MTKKPAPTPSPTLADTTATSATSRPSSHRTTPRTGARLQAMPLELPAGVNPGPLLPEPRRYTDGAGDPDCPHCHGMGYLREDVPPGHANFGKLVPCVCQMEHMAAEHADQLRRDSHIETLAAK